VNCAAAATVSSDIAHKVLMGVMVDPV